MQGYPCVVFTAKDICALFNLFGPSCHESEQLHAPATLQRCFVAYPCGKPYKQCVHRYFADLLLKMKRGNEGTLP